MVGGGRPPPRGLPALPGVLKKEPRPPPPPAPNPRRAAKAYFRSVLGVAAGQLAGLLEDGERIHVAGQLLAQGLLPVPPAEGRWLVDPGVIGTFPRQCADWFTPACG